MAVFTAAYEGTTALDKYLDGALHIAFGGAVEKVIQMEIGRPQPYLEATDSPQIQTALVRVTLVMTGGLRQMQ